MLSPGCHARGFARVSTPPAGSVSPQACGGCDLEARKRVTAAIRDYIARERISREQFAFRTKLGKSTVDKLLTGLFSERTLAIVESHTGLPLRAMLERRGGSRMRSRDPARDASGQPSIAVLPFANIERRCRPGLLRGRRGRGHHHGAVARSPAAGDRAQLLLHLQEPRRGCPRGRPGARRPLCAGRERAPGRRAAAHHRPVDRCGQRNAPVGRSLRRPAR